MNQAIMFELGKFNKLETFIEDPLPVFCLDPDLLQEEHVVQDASM